MFKIKRHFLVPVLMATIIVGGGSTSALLALPDREFLDAQMGATTAPESQRSQTAQEFDDNQPIERTYTLKHISIEEFMRAAKGFLINYGGTEGSLTIRFPRKYRPEIEALIKKLDVEKRTIRLKIYAIVASRDGAPGAVPTSAKAKTGTGEGATISGIKDAIEDKELKKVLDELKSLWNFQTYEIDGPSYLSIRENSGSNNFKLVTDLYLNLLISNLSIRGEESGQRYISIEQLKLAGKFNFIDEVYFDTHDVVMKERGYLVAGVSGFGSATKAIILVLSADIK